MFVPDGEEPVAPSQGLCWACTFWCTRMSYIRRMNVSDENYRDGWALVLRSGESMSLRSVACPSGKYSAVHQHDGNVIMYRNADAHPVFATHTNFQPTVGGTGPAGDFDAPGRLELRTDGNLVVLSPADEVLWSSSTEGESVSSLQIHDWGMLALLNDRGHAVWRTESTGRNGWCGWHAVPDGKRLRRGQRLRNNTLVSANGEYVFFVSETGVSCLCRADGSVLWAVNPSSWDNGLELTHEGVLIARTKDGVPWHLNTFDIPDDVIASELLVTDSGQLVLSDDSGQVVWTLRRSQPSQRSSRRPC